MKFCFLAFKNNSTKFLFMGGGGGGGAVCGVGGAFYLFTVSFFFNLFLVL